MNYKVFYLLLLTNFNLYSQNTDEIKLGCEILKFKSKDAGNLCEIVNTLNEYYDYLKYSNDFTNDIVNNKKPRKPPNTIPFRNTLKKNLVTVENYVNNLDVYSYRTKNKHIKIDNDKLFSEEIYIRRNYINKTVNQVLYDSKNLEYGLLLKQDLESIQNQLLAIKKSLVIMKKNFFIISNYSGNGKTEISKIFGFAGLDIENNIERQIGLIIKIITKKRIDLLNDLLAHVDKIEAGKKLCINALNFENSFLIEKIEENNENPKIDGLNMKISSHEKKMKKEYSSYFKYKTKYDDLQNELNLTNRRLKRSYWYKENGLKKLNELYKQKKEYSYCPNKNTFEKCTHIKKKNTYLFEMKNIDSEINDQKNYLQKTENIIKKRVDKKYKISTELIEAESKKNIWFNKCVNSEIVLSETKNELKNLFKYIETENDKLEILLIENKKNLNQINKLK